MRGGERMLWKLIIFLMRRRASPFIRTVKARNKVYIIQIEEYEPSSKLIPKMEKALEKETSKA